MGWKINPNWHRIGVGEPLWIKDDDNEDCIISVSGEERSGMSECATSFHGGTTNG